MDIGKDRAPAELLGKRYRAPSCASRAGAELPVQRDLRSLMYEMRSWIPVVLQIKDSRPRLARTDSWICVFESNNPNVPLAFRQPRLSSSVFQRVQSRETRQPMTGTSAR